MYVHLIIKLSVRYRGNVLARCPLQSEAAVAGRRVGVVADVQGLFPLSKGFLKQFHPSEKQQISLVSCAMIMSS